MKREYANLSVFNESKSLGESIQKNALTRVFPNTQPQVMPWQIGLCSFFNT